MRKNSGGRVLWSEEILMKLSEQPGMRESSLGFLIQIMARRIEEQMKTLLSEHNIDIKVFPNLITLQENDGISQRELASRFHMPEYSTSRHVDTLVRDGYAERRPDPESRRAVKVYLTDKGREKAALLPAIVRRCNATVLDGFDPEETELLMVLLKKLVKSTDG